jgi:hypothetical protein
MSARVLLALALALALVGCKKKEAEPAGASGATVATGPMDPLVVEVHEGLEKFRDRMCACKDVQCADLVQIELGAWIMTNKDRFGEIDTKSTPEQIAAAKKISAQHIECAGNVVQQQK